MAPKKKTQVEDQRSPLEINIANTQEQIRQCEAQAQQFREGVHDLATHTVKIKNLEADIVPKEAELKGIMHAFNKLLENSVTITKLKAIEQEPAGQPALPAVRMPSRAASRGGANSPPPPAAPGPLPLPSAEENSDREALKALSNAMRDCLTAMITPLFMMDRTTLEQQIEDAKEREAHEAAAAAHAAANPVVAAPLPAKPATPSTAPGGKAGAPAVKAPEPIKHPSLAELQERVDFELYRPPGLDSHVTADVLKLRQQRLATERQLKSLHSQLTYSRQLVARRTNEGASKAALKKVEKNLQFLQQTLRELERQRDEVERTRKSEGGAGPAAAAAKGAAAKAAQAAASMPPPPRK